MDKTLSAKIQIYQEIGNTNGKNGEFKEETLAYAILDNNKDYEYLNTTNDNYGPTYYFQGDHEYNEETGNITLAIDGNYLEFAEMCWKIVRIQGIRTIMQ